MQHKRLRRNDLSYAQIEGLIDGLVDDLERLAKLKEGLDQVLPGDKDQYSFTVRPYNKYAKVEVFARASYDENVLICLFNLRLRYAMCYRREHVKLSGELAIEDISVSTFCKTRPLVTI